MLKGVKNSYYVSLGITIFNISCKRIDTSLFI